MIEKVRILHFVPYLQAAGTETFIMNMYRNIDRSKVQFDFVVHRKAKGYYDDEILAMGGKIYYMSIKDDKNFFKYIKEINQLFKTHPEYKVVHSAMPSIAFLYLAIAKKNKIKVRIAHSHSAFHEKNIKGFLKHLTTKLIPHFSNVYLACSKEAGEYMFNKRDFTVIHNAIDLDKYKYNEEVRLTLRKRLNIEEKIVLGHVGRFSTEKNHIFMLNVLKKLLEVNPNYVLVLAGGGALENEIKEEVEKLNLSKNVIFLGICNNINEIMQAFDIFLLPSLFEGLPIVTVESQAAGLPTYCSDQVSKDAKLTSKLSFLPLDEEIWINKILSTTKEEDRLNYQKDDLEKEFNIKNEAKMLEEMYLDLIEKSDC